MHIRTFATTFAVAAISLGANAEIRDAVVDKDAPVSQPTADATESFTAVDGKYHFTLDTSETPDLTEWARQKLVPMATEWYPKLVATLPSEGFEAPTNISIVFSKDMQGVAATGGSRIRCAARWFKANLDGEAVGAVYHELVHVVQNYGWARQHNPNRTRTPGWLVEGIPDYIRWFKFEPQSHGADIVWMRGRRNFTPRYNASYRVTANFLDWVVGKYDPELIRNLNALCRQGKYSEEVWKERTGHTVQELGEEWKAGVLAQLGTETSGAKNAQPNELTENEKAEGWKLLFNGKDFSGWHNFKREGVRKGWQVKDGALTCVDPHDAGDLVTTEAFGGFELQLDYNISEGGNSGIMYHVTDQGGAAWATGPEFQLEDNAKAADPQRCGWLYALYEPPLDPKTGKPLDATKPAGEWNHVRLLISPEKCLHEINGVNYFEYVLGSDDFKQRVAKSKFGSMPNFAKSDSGYIALQGDHGQIAFRNIKIRKLNR